MAAVLVPILLIILSAAGVFLFIYFRKKPKLVSANTLENWDIQYTQLELSEKDNFQCKDDVSLTENSFSFSVLGTDLFRNLERSSCIYSEIR